MFSMEELCSLNTVWQLLSSEARLSFLCKQHIDFTWNHSEQSWKDRNNTDGAGAQMSVHYWWSTRNIWIKCGRITELRKIFKKHIKNNKYWKKLIMSCFLLGSMDRTRNTLLNTLFTLNNDHFTRPETGSFRFQARRCDFLTSLDDTNLSISNMRTESFSGRNSGSTRSCCTKLFPLRRRRRAESVCRYRAVTGLPGVMLLCPAVSLTDAHRR